MVYSLGIVCVIYSGYLLFALSLLLFLRGGAVIGVAVYVWTVLHGTSISLSCFLWW